MHSKHKLAPGVELQVLGTMRVVQLAVCAPGLLHTHAAPTGQAGQGTVLWLLNNNSAEPCCAMGALPHSGKGLDREETVGATGVVQKAAPCTLPHSWHSGLHRQRQCGPCPQALGQRQCSAAPPMPQSSPARAGGQGAAGWARPGKRNRAGTPSAVPTVK